MSVCNVYVCMQSSIACLFGASLLGSLTKIAHTEGDISIHGFLPNPGLSTLHMLPLLLFGSLLV